MPILLSFSAVIAAQVEAGRISDITNTPHNLSLNWGGDGLDNRTVKAVSETQLCVFCHTPHAAQLVQGAPLWNRNLSQETYAMYDSSSMEASKPSHPSNSSKLCLSCHDGTLAIGAVNVLGGKYDNDPLTAEIEMVGTDGLAMSAGSGTQTGYTRNLGVDLSNDHPISIQYDDDLAIADGELYRPTESALVGVRQIGEKPLIPLVIDHEDGVAKLECVSCHDPHIRDDSGEDIKFLRLNRFQNNAPPGDVFDVDNDLICLACHKKDGWLGSVHANPQVADEVYTTEAAQLRDFPDAMPVWRAACLNCHDSHTVAGARRLLREGTDDMNTPKNGGNSAIEETCYQCHSSDGNTLTTQGGGSQVPDIKGAFNSAYRMPITTADQPADFEVHDIGNTGSSGDGADMLESQLLLGKGDLNNRHVECTDCHNPHRSIRSRLAASPSLDLSAPDAAATHRHEDGVQHNNLISGALRGNWGIEPVYSTPVWDPLAPGISYQVKRGIPPQNDDMSGPASNYSYVTREYQICLKCHSDYGFDNNNPPPLGYSGGTAPGTNGMVEYTNQAFEFQAPEFDKGETGGNHRSWHPVIDNTGRTAVVRGNMDQSGFLAPWGDNGGENIGNQTMYCTDCHGSNSTGNTVVPDGGEDGNPWGPHGSSNQFILKGSWSSATGTNTPDALCFKCHEFDTYANPTPAVVKDSGFSGPQGTGGGSVNGCNMDAYANNFHVGHATVMGGMRCSWCHTMVPHGWKNKAFLVDISQELGAAPYSNGPYYENAWLGGGGPVVWKSSGDWTKDDCGGSWMNNSCNPTP